MLPVIADDAAAAAARTIVLHELLTQRIRELEEAAARVRTLTGLLRICSYCKAIRNDDDYWQKVEEYVIEHSEATFTHGICPPCFTKVNGSQP